MLESLVEAAAMEQVEVRRPGIPAGGSSFYCGECSSVFLFYLLQQSPCMQQTGAETTLYNHDWPGNRKTHIAGWQGLPSFKKGHMAKIVNAYMGQV